MEIRAVIKKILPLWQEVPVLLPPSEEQIVVSPATKRLASAYERFRNLLEPSENEILRRKAIARMIWRRVPANNTTGADDPAHATAVAILQELIRASYIEVASRQQAESMANYLVKLRQMEPHLNSEQFHWLVEMTAVALDRLIFPEEQDEALVHLMYHDTYRRTAWTDQLVNEADRPAQLFIACHRALLGAENKEITYHYFTHYIPAWRQAQPLTVQEQRDIAQQLPRLVKDIAELVEHPAGHRLTTLLRPIAVPYRILWRLLLRTNVETLSQEQLSGAVRESVTERGSLIVRRISTHARHSVLFLLLTKTILVFAVEVPYERFLWGKIHWGALAANTFFHPFMLLFLSATVRLPGEANTQKIDEQVHKIVSGESELATVVISSSRHYGPLTWTLFGLTYTILFVGIIWAVALLLVKLQFSLLAMFLFVFFLGLVSILAARNRRSIDDLRVIPKIEGTFSIIVSFLFLPVLEFGSWLSRNVQKMNVPLFLMDRLLEAPFKLLIDLVEEWFIFIRERREEIV
jgi:hypothetical protein